MPKFAHMSDIHIGAFGSRYPELRELVLQAFDLAIDKCIDAGVDFVVIAGDTFDSNIPDLSSVKHAAAKILKAKEQGISFYVVYGSHDFSPNYSSIVDVLESAGLLTKLEKVTRREDGKLDLAFTTDKSGAKLCGISGKKLGLDRLDYELLDKEHLEKEDGFKIFVFHGALEEYKPHDLSMMEAMSVSRLPEGFNYYAGGHIHQRSISSLKGRRNLAYPGPLFGTDFRDLESIAKGNESGFYIVDFDKDVKRVEFVEVTPCRIVELEFSAQGKSASQTYAALQEIARRATVDDQVMLLKVHGELSQGKTSDIDFGSIRKQFLAKKPISFLLSYSQLDSLEQLAVAGAKPISPSLTEKEIFEKRISKVASAEPRLRGASGVQVSLSLLKALKDERRENELKPDYQSRIEKSGANVLGLEKTS
jgi:DNA repair protein SbcD/Mre11